MEKISFLEGNMQGLFSKISFDNILHTKTP